MLNTDVRRISAAAIAVPPAITRNGLSKGQCELSDKTKFLYIQDVYTCRYLKHFTSVKKQKYISQSGKR